jgi:hypothetical protein
MQKKFRDSFNGTEIHPARWEIAATGGGIMHAVADGAVTISTGTTLDDELTLTSRTTFTIPLRVMVAVNMSQWIVGQSVWLELVSIDPTGRERAAQQRAPSASFPGMPGSIGPVLWRPAWWAPDGFAAIPTTIIDPPLVRSLRRSLRCTEPCGMASDQRAVSSSHKVCVWDQAQFCLDRGGRFADSRRHGSTAII